MTTLINLDELYKKKIDILVERDAIWRESHPCSKNVINAIKYDDGKKHPQDAYIRNINKIISRKKWMQCTNIFTKKLCYNIT